MNCGLQINWPCLALPCLDVTMTEGFAGRQTLLRYILNIIALLNIFIILK